MKLLLLLLLLARPPATVIPQPPRAPAWDVVREGETWLYLCEVESGGLYQAWPSGSLATYSVLSGWRTVHSRRVR